VGAMFLTGATLLEQRKQFHVRIPSLQKHPISPISPSVGTTPNIFHKTLSQKEQESIFLSPTWPDHNSVTEVSDKGIGALGSPKFATPYCKFPPFSHASSTACLL